MCEDSVIDFVDRNGRRFDSEAKLKGVVAACEFVCHARRSGVKDLYFTNSPTVDTHYYAVGFEDGYGMAIKACRVPTPEMLSEWLKGEIGQSGPVFEYYEIGEDELYAGYDCDNLGAWPVFGLDPVPDVSSKDSARPGRPTESLEPTAAGSGAGCTGFYLVDKNGFSLTSEPQFEDITEGEVFLRFARGRGVNNLYLTANPAGYDWFCDERSGRYRVYFPADETEVLDITGDVTPAAIEELLRERSEWCPDGAILGYIEIDGE